MIKAWILDVSPLYCIEKYNEVYNTLPYFRRLKADNIKSAENKAQSAGVWFLLQHIRDKYNISEKAVFNLSHTGKYAVCAIDTDENENTKVGVDAEEIHHVPLKLAKRFYCDSEYEHVVNIKEDKKENELIRIWVLKESFMKAVRKGMALDTRAFEFNLDGEAYLEKQPDEYREKYYFKEYNLEELKVRAAVCSTDSNISPDIDISLIDLLK